MPSKYSFVKEMIETAKSESKEKKETAELEKGVKGVFGKLKFSVIVPSYNDRKNLIKCLQSLAQLNYPKDRFELMVVDDGSTDRSLEAAEDFATEHPKLDLTIIRQENKGPCGARNTGLKKAKNEFIAFIDSDELAEPNWLKNAQKYFENEKVGAIEGKVIVLQKEKITPFTHQTLVAKGREFVTANMVYRKKVIDEAGGFDERFYDRERKVHFREDADLAFTVLEKGHEIAFADDVITFHPPKAPLLTRPLKLAQRYYFEPLLYKKHPEMAKKCIGNFNFEGWAVKRPRQRSYLINCLALIVGILGIPILSGLAWAFFWLSYFFIYWLHIRFIPSKNLALADLLVLIPTAFLVPWFFLEAFIRGTIKFNNVVI